MRTDSLLHPVASFGKERFPFWLIFESKDHHRAGTCPAPVWVLEASCRQALWWRIAIFITTKAPAGTEADLNCHKKKYLQTTLGFPFLIHTAHLGNERTKPQSLSIAHGEPLHLILRSGVASSAASEIWARASGLVHLHGQSTFIIRISIYNVCICVNLYESHVSRCPERSKRKSYLKELNFLVVQAILCRCWEQNPVLGNWNVYS